MDPSEKNLSEWVETSAGIEKMGENGKIVTME